MSAPSSTALNAICPYFTMFPLEFPLQVLEGSATGDGWVLDPFSGRGTTNYAARLMGLPSVGVDSSPVATALTEAKLANATPAEIVACAEEILQGSTRADSVPEGEFWGLAYRPDVLKSICLIRDSLLANCQSPQRKALRAVVMGALHGPRTKSTPSYLSNQSTRTYAPKPRYAVKFWRSRGLEPPRVNVREVVRRRAEHYYAAQRPAVGVAIGGDSRELTTFGWFGSRRVQWIVTSPPYYGMRTYIPDQWLRNWFVGGPSVVDYSNRDQLAHGGAEVFASQLGKVWDNVATVATSDASLVVRFGGITDRRVDPLTIMRASFEGSPWVLTAINEAGSAELGRRQSIHFATTRHTPRTEYDVWARLRS